MTGVLINYVIVSVSKSMRYIFTSTIILYHTVGGRS